VDVEGEEPWDRDRDGVQNSIWAFRENRFRIRPVRGEGVGKRLNERGVYGWACGVLPSPAELDHFFFMVAHT
jgi:hypothetical protein